MLKPLQGNINLLMKPRSNIKKCYESLILLRDDMFNLTNCRAFPGNQASEVRVHSISGITCGWDKLCLKSRLWRALKVYYGHERASLLMPLSFELKGCNKTDIEEREGKKENQIEQTEEGKKETRAENETAAELNQIQGRCEIAEIVEKLKVEKEKQKIDPTYRSAVYITKNPMLSMQKGRFLLYY